MDSWNSAASHRPEKETLLLVLPSPRQPERRRCGWRVSQREGPEEALPCRQRSLEAGGLWLRPGLALS